MKNKHTTYLVAAAIVGATAMAAYAHGGATGVVRERMDAMSVMGDTVKSLSDMFRSGDYRPELVANGADALLMHSGAQLTALFPEGTAGAPSEAKSEVWSEWEEFSALADDLDRAAAALKASAANPRGNGSADNSMMDGGMGASAMGGNMMGGADTMPSPQMLAAMPTDRVFDVVVRTCSSCHTRFRIEK